MDYVVLVGKIQNQQQLNSEAPHHLVRDHAVGEPSPKASQGLTDELEDKADVSTVGTLVLKVID